MTCLKGLGRRAVTRRGGKNTEARARDAVCPRYPGDEAVAVDGRQERREEEGGGGKLGEHCI